jgi:hypothetical protein
LLEGSSTAGLGRFGTSGSTFSLPSSCLSCRGGGTGATLFGCCALSWLSSASGFIWGVVDLCPDACRQEQKIKGAFYLLFFKSTHIFLYVYVTWLIGFTYQNELLENVLPSNYLVQSLL